jgi:HNH endonuclease
MDEKTIARFWAKVDIREPHECWPWKACRLRFGRGRFALEGAQAMAHRVAFFIANGRWPRPCACHRCDNPPCCNPAHLFEGTRADNNADMFAKGRRVVTLVGIRNPKAKLTDDAVRIIRAGQLSRRELCGIFGVSRSTVGAVQRGEFWKHVR